MTSYRSTQDDWTRLQAKHDYENWAAAPTHLGDKPKDWDQLGEADQQRWYAKAREKAIKSEKLYNGPVTYLDYDAVLEYQSVDHTGNKVAWMGGPNIHSHLDSYDEWKTKKEATLRTKWWQLHKPTSFDKSHEAYWEDQFFAQKAHEASELAKRKDFRAQRRAQMAKRPMGKETIQPKDITPQTKPKL